MSRENPAISGSSFHPLPAASRERRCRRRCAHWDLGELWRALPAVDRQRQYTAHPRIVEQLSLVVGLDKAAAVPVAGLHSDLVTQRIDELVAD